MRYRRFMLDLVYRSSAIVFFFSAFLPACGNKTPPASTGEPPIPEYCPNATGLSKGPWVVRVDGSSAVVRWEACRSNTPGGLTFKTESGGESTTADSKETALEITTTNIAALDPTAPKDEAGTYYLHEAALSGLTAGTCYQYQLAVDATATGRFCTARPPGTNLSFLAIGDTNPGLNGITEKLLAKVVPKGFDFTVHAGDVQYYDSGLETWASWFPRMQPLLSQGAFLPAVGNHESEKPEEMDQYYKRFFGGAGFEGTDEYYRYETGGIWFFSLDTELDVALGSPQGNWLATSLADVAKKPNFKTSIVYFHRPWMTCGDTGEDTMAREQFEPIFAANGVKLVIQAHMHGYERFDYNGRTYLTTGGGGGAIDNVDANIDRPTCAQRVASGAFRHAVFVEVKAAQLEGTVIDETGTTRDTFTISLGP
jgi:acid phosphatase type 7